MLDTIKNFLGKYLPGKPWLILLAGIVIVPILAFQAMRDRVARETNLQKVPLDDKLPNLFLESSSKELAVVYQDGTRLPADTLGVSILTWEDYKAAPERLGGTGVVWTTAAFPVLAFFNASGFDATGNPVVIRKAADGELLFKAATLVPPVRLAVVQRDGSFKILKPASSVTVDAPWLLVSGEDWDKTYMANGSLLPPEKLAGLTDEKLKELGYVRVPKSTSGLLGRVLRVGGNVNAVEPLALTVKIFQGKVGPKTPERKLVTSVTSAKDGSFTVELTPGEYTLAVEEEGKLYGNAFNQDNWPSVQIQANQWLEYEFRRSP